MTTEKPKNLRTLHQANYTIGNFDLMDPQRPLKSRKEVSKQTVEGNKRQSCVTDFFHRYNEEEIIEQKEQEIEGFPINIL